MVAETEEQYRGVLELFPYHNVQIDSAPYPRLFPFSGVVGQVYCQLQAFIRNCSDYADGLNLRYVQTLPYCYCVSLATQSNGSV